ncbi:MAG TPA: DNA polymerase III subunit chi [Caulobacteraceae bacterium]
MSGQTCEVWFYHLERSALDGVLPELLEKTLAKGWRALVKVRSEELLAHLDRLLWVYRDDSFLAHGTDEEPGAAKQPILLTRNGDNLNDALALFLVEGATPEDLSAFSRCIMIFDGHDEAALADARLAWSAFRSAGHTVAYWREGGKNGWEKQGS